MQVCIVIEERYKQKNKKKVSIDLVWICLKGMSTENIFKEEPTLKKYSNDNYNLV